MQENITSKAVKEEMLQNDILLQTEVYAQLFMDQGTVESLS